MAAKRGEASRLKVTVLGYCLPALAILSSAAVCIFLQDLAPTGHGPEYLLFPYNGELVAIGLTGGVLPLLVSAVVLAAWMGPKAGKRRGVFRSPAYWLAVVVVSIFVTLFFSAAHELYGGLGLPKLWAFWLVFVGGVIGVDYWWLRGRRLKVGEGTAECYVLGTLSVFASDVTRTLTGLASAPGEAAVWGGGGLLDLLFWFGLYIALSFLILRIFLSLIPLPSRA